VAGCSLFANWFSATETGPGEGDVARHIVPLSISSAPKN
jgi:hypothetical protein